MRRLALLVGAAVLAAAPVGAAGPGAAPAAAHDVLIASSPEDGATVPQAPGAVELTFDNAVQTRFAQVAVLDADEQPYHEGEPEVVGPTVTQPLGDLPEGEYTVSYRVVSSDGHPVSGTITFSVGGSGAADPTADPSVEAPAETTSETPEQSPDDSAPASEPTVPPADDADTAASGDAGGGPSTAVIILVIVGAAVVVGGIAYLMVGGRGGGSTEDTGA